MEQPKKKKNIWKRLARIVLKTILFIFLFLVLIIILIQTPIGQNFVRKQAVSYLQKKLKTKVAIGRLYINFTKKVVIDDIYVEDRQQDTLLYGGKIKVDVSIVKLIFGDFQINEVQLENVTAKIKRQLPDTTFNFQFIVDAFVSPSKEPKTEPDTASSSPVPIKSVKLDKIRVVYKDVVSGMDSEAWLEHFDTKIDKLDPGLSLFDIPRTHISGLTARVYQTKPLSTPDPVIKDKIEAQEPIAMKLLFKELDLQKIKVDFRNDVSSFYANLDLGQLNVKPQNIDLEKRIVHVDALTLQNTNAAIRLGKQEQAKVVEEEVEQEVQSQHEAGWRIMANTLRLDNNNLQFDNDNSPKQPKGMDYAHLKTTPLTLHVDDLLYSEDSIAGSIKQTTINEQSGFQLQALQTDFIYSATGASLSNLYLKTPGTELKRSAAIRYASLDALKNDLGNMQLDLQLDNSRVMVKDVLTFVPSLQEQPAFADPNTVWYINSAIKGRVADMQIDGLQVSGLGNTKIDVKGQLKGLPDIDKASANLVINTISSSRSDILKFVPKKSLPQGITFPDRFALNGRINGNMGKLSTDLALKTNLGNALVKGEVQQITDARKAKYDVVVQTQSLDLGTILQDKETLGPLSARVTVKGTGYDTKTANASLNGVVQSAVFKKYTYRNLLLKGAIANQQATIDAGITDPNIHVAINANADLAASYPAVKLTAMIDSIKTKNLNLTPDDIVYHGKIDADFASTNPDSLDGKLLVTESLLLREGQRVQLDTISLVAGRSDSGQYVYLNSDVVIAQLQGRYKLTDMGTVIERTMQPYFAMKGADSISTKEPYDFTLDARIIDGPALKAFVPSLTRLDSFTLRSRFSSTEGWTADLNAPAIEVGANSIKGLKLVAGTSNNAINIDLDAQEIKSGSSIQLYATSLDARLANNEIDFNLNTKDKEAKDKYNIAGLLQQPESGTYALSLKPDSLLLNYDKWTANAGNKIVYSDAGINASNFTLSKNGQQLQINSLSAEANAPLEVSFQSFKIATLTGFVQSDSNLVDGTLNGKAQVSNITTDPLFTADLTVDNLSVQKDTVGNVKILVDNKTANTYTADMAITGRGNDVRLNGTYNVATSSADMNLDIRELPMTTAQAFSNGAIRDASGSVNGGFKVTGSLSQPSVIGDLNFNKTGFNLSMLNNYFRIDQEKISVTNQGITFDRFEIKDSANNALTIDGTAATSNFSNYKLDLDINARNFRALNSTKKDNKIFYGKLFFDANLHVSGTEASPVIDGRFKVNKDTKMTVVLPQGEPGIADREGIVEFVDMDAPISDSLFNTYDSLNYTAITGIEASVNVEVDKEADLTLIVDEGTGDFLNVKGEALITTDINKSGDITLAGSYELEEGAYQLNFNGIKRKFDIQKGSKLTWGGEPTDAEVNITAVYVANTSPLDLVKGQLGDDVSATERNTYLQKLPFNVQLKMTGKLLQPKITFDIVLPDNRSYIVSNDIIVTVNNKLEQLRKEEGEMNKQVFGLLSLNRFIPENPFSSSTSGGALINTNALLRQSVSKLMTEQLNRLASDLVKGVDLNFDVQASEDYTTGQRADRTDLNVGLFKRLFNDRLTVTVGSNFELEGPQASNQQSSNIAGNVAVDYRLSKDGRYLLRAYRKNEYQGVIDGYIIETGVGFIITLDYNRFRDIFRQKKIEAERKQRREQREKERLEKEKQEKETKPAGTQPAQPNP